MAEVILQKIVFSDGADLTLSLVVREEDDRNILKWVVSSEGRSSNPVMFFGESEMAMEEFKKRCGEEMLHGRLVESNDVFGSLRGYFIQDKRATEPVKIKRSGYKIVKKSPKETAAWRKKIFGYSKKTLKLVNK